MKNSKVRKAMLAKTFSGTIGIMVLLVALTSIFTTFVPTAKAAPSYLTLRPDGQWSTYYQWTDSPDVGNEHWQNVDDAVADGDTTRLSHILGAAVKIDIWTMEDHTTELGDIESVTVYFTMKASGWDIEEHNVEHLCGNYSIVMDNEWLEITSDYVEYSKVYTTSPTDGQPWDWEEVDNMQLGVQAHGSALPECNASVTQAYAVVKYTAVGYTATLNNPTEDGYIYWDGDYYRDNTDTRIYFGGYGEEGAWWDNERGYVEWDISSLAGGTLTANPVFKYEGVQIENYATDAEINPITEGQPSVISDEDLYGYIASGTAYVDPFNFQEGENKEVDLGASAKSDLWSAMNASQSWFAIGFQSPDDEGAIKDNLSGIHTEEATPTPPPTLYVEYTPVGPLQSNQKIWNATTKVEKSLNAIDVDLYPTSFNVTINDADGDKMNITILTNATGPWTVVNQTSDGGLSNGTYSYYNTSWVDAYNTKYWISFNVTDGTDYVNETYHFTTRFSSNGSGTVADPYQITNCAELNETRDNLTAHYILMNDINMSECGVINWNGGAGFIPIGTSANKFLGSFDGQNYTIGNLFIDRDTTDYVGLFGYVGTTGIVKYVKVVDVNVTGADEVGGLAGLTLFAIQNCYSSGNISGDNSVGGLVGYNAGGTGIIQNSYSTASVSGTTLYAGGLVGENEGQIIQNSYSTGAVSGNDNVGGLVGVNAGTIQKCYSTGAVSGNDNVGGLIGADWDTVTYSYWDNETSGQVTSGGGTGRTTAQMTYDYVGYDPPCSGLYETWDLYEKSIWIHDENSDINNGYPYLNPYPPARHVGPGQTYSTIQDAIDASNDGDTIIIHEDTYNERLLIDGFNGLTIKGLGNREVIIDDPHSGGYYDTIHARNANNLTIENLKLTDADSYSYGIYISEGSSSPPFCENVIIRNVTIVDNDASNAGGITIDMVGMDGVGNVQIYDCWIDNCVRGIVHSDASNTLIYHNNITGCSIPLWHIGVCSNNTYDIGGGAGQGGNWLSNYDSAGEGAYDNNSDGVADDAYTFNDGGSANYSFMQESGWIGWGGVIDTAPTQSDEVPGNSSTGISLTPDLYVLCTDVGGDNMNATWWSNSSGTWLQFASNWTSFEDNTNITQSFTNATDYSQIYYWSLNLTDGTDWCNETYHFITKSSIVITNPYPTNNSENVSIVQDIVNVTIEHLGGLPFNWTINGTYVDVNSSTDDTNGSKEANLTILTYNIDIVWHVNITDGICWANKTYQFSTQVNNSPVYSNLAPSDEETNVELDIGLISFDINDSEGDLMNYSVTTAPNIGSGSGNDKTNGTYTFPISSLSYATTYYWTLKTTDGISWNNQTYYFTTICSSDNPPNVPTNPNPSDGATNESVDIGSLSCSVSDPDGGVLNVTFKWGNGTLIGYDSPVASGGRAEVSISTLQFNTTYEWLTIANDSTDKTQSAVWDFTTEVEVMKITLSPTSYGFGVVDFGDSGESTSITVSNIGEVSITKIELKVSDMQDIDAFTTWDIESAPGINDYAIRYYTEAKGTWSALSDSYTDIGETINAGNEATFKLKMYMPTLSTFRETMYGTLIVRYTGGSLYETEFDFSVRAEEPISNVTAVEINLTSTDFLAGGILGSDTFYLSIPTNMSVNTTINLPDTYVGKSWGFWTATYTLTSKKVYGITSAWNFVAIPTEGSLDSFKLDVDSLDDYYGFVMIPNPGYFQADEWWFGLLNSARDKFIQGESLV